MRYFLTSLFLALGLVASAQTVTDTTAVQSDTRTIVNSFLSELLEFSKDAGAFAKEQVPLVLKEYVYWGIAEGVSVSLLCIVWMLLYRYVVKKWALKAANEDDEMAAIMFLVAGGIMSAIAFVFMCVAIMQVLQASIAPRVYLIETLSRFIR